MIMKCLDDCELISLYINGDEKAFEQLLMRHKDRLYRFIFLKVKDGALADDLFQETFVKIINTLKLGLYNEEGKFLPWALRIAHNLVIDYFRRKGKVRMFSESSSQRDDYTIFSVISCETKNAQEQLMSDELENQMVDLIDYLPQSQKDILKMRVFQDLSFKEIAEMEDISINTALGRMRYALINMRKLIEKHQLVVDF
jgi:RNA polymerase sigma-70 factor (ECF subfamily)